ERARSRLVGTTDQAREALTYGIVLAIVLSLITAFLMTFISPTFVKMFAEFGLRLPGTFQALVRAADWIAYRLPLGMLLGLLAFGFIRFARPNRYLRGWFGVGPLSA